VKTDFATRHFLLFITIGLLLSACAVDTYKKPVGDLTSAIETSITTVQALDKKITKVRNERWSKGIAEGTILLETVDNSCAEQESGCSLEIHPLTGPPVLFPAKSVIPKGLVGLTALRAYAANLKAIVDEETADAVTTSTNKALGSLKNIEKAVAEAKGDPPAESVIDAYSQPVASLVNWAVGTYVDVVKYHALAKATRDADPVIRKLADYHQTLADAFTSYESAIAREAFVNAQTAFDKASIDGSLTQAKVNTYVQAAAAYDVVLRASAADPLGAFLAAHTKLKQQLNREGKITLDDAFASIEDLKQRAETFKEIMDAFGKAAEENG